MSAEIFDREIYRFDSEKTNPYIIDCGANIGLSVIFFKRMYLSAEILAFEPDAKAYAALAKNTTDLSNVRIIQKGLAGMDGQVDFFSEGADGGRLATDHDTLSRSSIEVTRLSPFLDKEVDLLKIDIEGSELEVLRECANNLGKVSKIFVEYHSLASKAQELGGLLRILKDAGFRYYIESTGVHSTHPFSKIEEHLNYDNQLNIFAYRPFHE
jgi:FkbM family methyltransferase